MTRANQQRVVSLTTAITRTEDLLSTLRERMTRNRLKGRERYKVAVRASTSSKSQSTVVPATASKSSEVQTPKQRDAVSATLSKEDKPTSTGMDKVLTGQKAPTHASVTVTSIVEETYTTEQNLAAQV